MSLPAKDQITSDFAACVGFYTRIPIRRELDPSRPFIETQWAAPLAGALIGLVVGLLLWLFLSLGVHPNLAAALALGGGIVLTGALHEDGLADTADGFWGGKTREHKLEIMRDSRVGSYGVLALILSALIRWSALASFAFLSPLAMILAIIAAHAGSRAIIPALMVHLPPARSDGLSASAGTPPKEIAALAATLGVLIALLSGFWFALLAAVLLGIVLLALENIAESQIGGQTGDVAGALQQIGEIVLLALAATLLT